MKVKRPEKASQTLLSRLDVCPQSAEFYLRTKDDPVTSHALARGQIFHTFVERAVRMLVDSDEPSMPPEVAKELAMECIRERKDVALPESEMTAIRAMSWNWAEAT